LQKIGVPLVQGFLFARPAPLETIWLSQRIKATG